MSLESLQGSLHGLVHLMTLGLVDQPAQLKRTWENQISKVNFCSDLCGKFPASQFLMSVKQFSAFSINDFFCQAYWKIKQSVVSEAMIRQAISPKD